MGRSSNARERLLDAACSLMRTRSYGAVGIAEICTQADVRKGSFYHFFESKQALTLEAIDIHWSAQRDAWTATLQAPGPAFDRLRQLFHDTIEVQRRSRDSDGAVAGCVLANLALELSTQDETVRARLQEIFNEQIQLVEATLREAATEGRIGPGNANRSTARAVVAQMEGMVLFAKIGNDPEVLADAWTHARLLLGG